MKSASEKAIIFLSTSLVILSAALIAYSGLNMRASNPVSTTIDNSIVADNNFNTQPDVLGASSLDTSVNPTPQPEPITQQNPPAQPTTASAPYVNLPTDPLSAVKPKDFYFTSTTTDLNSKRFRLKYEDGTYSDYQSIEGQDNLKGDTQGSISKASEIYKFDKNFTDIEIENNPGDISITFINDPANNLMATDLTTSYSYETTYKKKLFQNFGINLITREEWGAPSYSAWTPEFAKVNRIVVHHTATSVDMANTANTVRAVYNDHKIRCSDNSGYYPYQCSIDNTWSDIGYNYLIDPYGNVYEGRAGGNGVIGAHAIPNSGSIGIALLGNYSTDVPAPAMLNSLKNLIGSLSFLNDFKVIWQESLFGHRDYLNTECPGNQVYSRLPQIALDSEVIRQSFGSVSNYRDLIGKLSFGQDFINSNPSITDVDGISHVYLVADNIDDQMKLKIKSTETWSGTISSEEHGDNVLVFITKALAPTFIGEVGLSIPGIQFSTDLP